MHSVSLSTHPAFRLTEQHYIQSLDIHVQKYLHKVTGAVHFHLQTPHQESAFLLAFRTHPMNAKGTAHVLEHTVLCGSQQFPVRDPFFAMMRRSLKSYMNAITSSDYTAYIFASANKKDFQNLLRVYLDAVFAANLHPLDFAQEGIRVEFENQQPVYKGVVFNEMKGALSSPARQLYHRMAAHLHPTTCYHYNSGGEPEHISDLSHQELLAFYQKHYHPSNAVFMSFGAEDVSSLHQQFEDLALAKFTASACLSSQLEPALSTPVFVSESYAIQGTALNDKCYHAIAWLFPESTDIVLYFALQLIEKVLLENAASPLMHYLQSCTYAKSIGPLLGLDGQNNQMSFSCSLQASEPEYAEQFCNDVLQILQSLASQPIDATLIASLIDQIELSHRDMPTSLPYGLSFLFGGLSRCLHQGNPIDQWDIDASLLELKQRIQHDPMWLSNLIQHYFIDNPHRVQLCFVADADKATQIQQAEQDKLAALAARLSQAERQQLQQQAEQLKLRQQQIENHDILPQVKLADVAEQIQVPHAQQLTLGIAEQSCPLIVYPTASNGLYYYQLLLDMDDAVLDSPYLDIYTSLLGQLGAGNADYLSIQHMQTENTGGVWMNCSLRAQIGDPQQISRFLVLSTKSLADKHQAIALLKLIFEQLRFDEKTRIMELLQQQLHYWQSELSASAASYALRNASRHMSRWALHQEQHFGLVALQRLQNLLAQINQDAAAYATMIEQLQGIHQHLLNSKRHFLLVCEDKQIQPLHHSIQQQWQNVAQASEQPALHAVDYRSSNTNQAWLMQSNVQCCAQVHPAVSIEHADAAVFMVLGPYLKNGFLHHAIREQGGAYGAEASYQANSCAFSLYSSRDPRLAQTFADFDASLHWLLQQPADAQALESAILTCIAGIDKPSTPSNEAIVDCHANLHGRSAAMRQQLRHNLLQVTLEDLKRVTVEYLLKRPAQRSVLAPQSREDELKQLGFEVHSAL